MSANAQNRSQSLGGTFNHRSVVCTFCGIRNAYLQAAFAFRVLDAAHRLANLHRLLGKAAGDRPMLVDRDEGRGVDVNKRRCRVVETRMWQRFGEQRLMSNFAS